jgi:hypothetical protein
MSSAPEEFRWPAPHWLLEMSRTHHALLTLGPDRLRYVHGLRPLVLTYDDIVAYGLRDRSSVFALMSAPELLIAYREGAAFRCTAIPFDLKLPACQAALAALRRALPHADTSALPWPDAAARLGVPVCRWYENACGFIGIMLICVAVGTGAALDNRIVGSERLCLGLAVIAGLIAGGVLIVLGLQRTRR